MAHSSKRFLFLRWSSPICEAEQPIWESHCPSRGGSKALPSQLEFVFLRFWFFWEGLVVSGRKSVFLDRFMSLGKGVPMTSYVFHVLPWLYEKLEWSWFKFKSSRKALCWIVAMEFLRHSCWPSLCGSTSAAQLNLIDKDVNLVIPCRIFSNVAFPLKKKKKKKKLVEDFGKVKKHALTYWNKPKQYLSTHTPRPSKSPYE